MNLLTKSLVSEIVGDNLVTAVYGGGFKPPTKGHLEVVQKALSDFPEIDKFIIYVGSGERNGITQEESLLIWDIYKNYLPEKVEIQPSKAPIGDILRYAKNNPEEVVYFVIGARAGNEDDIKDITLRTTGVEDKYPNIKVKTIETPDANVSGTKARTAAKQSPEAFYQFLPSNLTDDEKIEIFGYIQDVVTEKINENASYSKDIDYKNKIIELTNYMRDKGYNIDPLPSVEFINGDSENARDFFGKTAYYNPNTNTIVLYTEGRHPKDIVRSFSHEMVHHIQNLEGRLGNITTTNTHEDDNLNDLEKEANLKGTMTFRNWTDSLAEAIVGDRIKEAKEEVTDSMAVVLSRNDNQVNLYDLKTNEALGNINTYGNEVTGVAAKKGYGPLMYELGMANIYPNGLQSDRRGNTEPAAETIWKKYIAGASPNIKVEKLTPEDEEYRTEYPDGNEIWDVDGFYNYKFYNPNTTTLEQLIQRGNTLSDELREKIISDNDKLYMDLVNEAIVGDKIECDGCGWSWKIVDGGDDLYTCHKCGHDNTPLEEKKNKDPFGLNAYALELARGLEESLNEGRYDSISRQLASIALNSWKSDFKDGASYGYFMGEITPEEYPTDLTFTFKALGRFVDGNYTHNGYSRSDGEVGVKYEIPKDSIPQIWEEVYMDLISTIRHEIEHQTQSGKNVKPGKGMASDQELRKLISKGGSDLVAYVTLPKEIESNVQGLYLKAKKWRRPYDEVADEYIKDFLKITNPADVSYVKNKWQEVAKKRNLPSLLNEGRYDTLANQLSKIAFESFKDIHDRGDREGEFSFRVDHPDDEHDIPSEEFYFDFVGKVEITDDEYEVNGGANAGFDNKGNEIPPLLSVKFKIPQNPTKNPSWEDISFDIKDVVRHELEHLTQDGDNEKGGAWHEDPKLRRPSKYMEDDQMLRDLIDLDLLPKADYFRLPKEIDAMLQGLYFKAKKSKRPYRDVIDAYLDTQPINDEERENILKIWRSRAKSLSLPVFEQNKNKVMNEVNEQKYTIYCDMDGVLVDFDKQFEKASGGISPREYEEKNGKEAFWNLIDNENGVGFWVGMPWMPNGKQLWEYIKPNNPMLLSSPSRSNSSRLGKRLWVRNNLPGTKLILANSYNKKNYADGNNILIDDRPSNIDQWKAAGGIGILFISTAQTIEELKELGL